MSSGGDGSENVPSGTLGGSSSAPSSGGPRARVTSERATTQKGCQAKKRSGTSQAREKADDKSLSREVRARARLINGKDPKSRLTFIRDEASKSWVRGNHSRELAKIWNVSLSTVQQAAHDAFKEIQLHDSAEQGRSIFWEDMFEEMEQVRELRERFHGLLIETFDRMTEKRSEGGGRGVTPMDLKMLAESFGVFATANDKSREKLGRAASILAAGPVININQVLSATIKVAALGEHEMPVKELDAFTKRLLELVLGSRDEALRLAVRNEIRQLRGHELVTVEAEKGGES